MLLPFLENKQEALGLIDAWDRQEIRVLLLEIPVDLLNLPALGDSDAKHAFKGEILLQELPEIVVEFIILAVGLGDAAWGCYLLLSNLLG